MTTSPSSAAAATMSEATAFSRSGPSYLDMIVKLRRVLIAAQYQPEAPDQPTHEEIRVVRPAWVQAAM